MSRHQATSTSQEPESRTASPRFRWQSYLILILEGKLALTVAAEIIWVQCRQIPIYTRKGIAHWGLYDGIAGRLH
jgi:hypothetical protein